MNECIGYAPYKYPNTFINDVYTYVFCMNIHRYAFVNANITKWTLNVHIYEMYDILYVHIYKMYDIHLIHFG